MASTKESRRAAIIIGVASVLALAGCGNLNTQFATLKPVAGDAITELNIAVNDVLLTEKVEARVVPTCTYEPTTYTCSGTTMSGQEISATAQGASPETFTLTVGGQVLYDGSIDEVVRKAAQR